MLSQSPMTGQIAFPNVKAARPGKGTRLRNKVGSCNWAHSCERSILRGEGGGRIYGRIAFLESGNEEAARVAGRWLGWGSGVAPCCFCW